MPRYEIATCKEMHELEGGAKSTGEKEEGKFVSLIFIC